LKDVFERVREGHRSTPLDPHQTSQLSDADIPPKTASGTGYNYTASRLIFFVVVSSIRSSRIVVFSIF
jgi:hypothetical protein